MAIKILQNVSELPKNGNYVLDFFASWCGPCKAMSKTLDDLDKSGQIKVDVYKVDVEQHQGLATTYKVSSIPTIFFIGNGEVVDKHFGVMSKAAFLGKIDKIDNPDNLVV